MKIKTGIVSLAVLVTAGVHADSVTHGGTTINMDFVNIGYAGNVADGSGYGAVADNYRIGKFEVTAAQWASVIVADSNVGNAGSWSGSQPTASSSWYEAAKFANWLTSGSYNNGAYQFSDPSTLTGVDRAAAVATYGTVYVLPTEDEWYKAAYFKSDGSGYTLYATGDTAPTAGLGGENYSNAIGSPWNVGTGLAENNGTFDMNGNIYEWNEGTGGGFSYLQGGEFSGNEFLLQAGFVNSYPKTAFADTFGFRVSVIPEPGVISLMAVFGGGIWIVHRFFPRV